MVALLHPEDFQNEPVARPELRVIQGGRVTHESGTRSGSTPSAASLPGTTNTVALALAVVVVLLFVLFRVAQGTPPASSWEGVADSAYGGSAYGGSASGETSSGATDSVLSPPAIGAEEIYIVQAGDSLWAIAERLAPGQDPRPLVDAMSERNGGSALQIGQQLIVPLASPAP